MAAACALLAGGIAQGVGAGPGSPARADLLGSAAGAHDSTNRGASEDRAVRTPTQPSHPSTPGSGGLPFPTQPTPTKPPTPGNGGGNTSTQPTPTKPPTPGNGGSTPNPTPPTPKPPTPGNGGSTPNPTPPTPKPPTPGNGGSTPNPILVPPVAPEAPVVPVIPGGGTTAASPRSGGAGPTIAATVAAAVPSRVPTSGLAAGRGPVTIHVFVDLGDPDDAAAHLRITPVLLRRVATDGTATVLLSPLCMGRDANSIEAAAAMLAASRQNRAWSVAAGLAGTRLSRDGDWLTAATLKRVVVSVKGLTTTRFLNDAKARVVYRDLNIIRQSARASGVTATPSYVVTGGKGKRVVTRPDSVNDILAAIEAVQ